MESDLAERRSFIDYLNYMLFFPTILAGPIERYHSFVRQFEKPELAWADILPAMHRIANGCI